jgi:ABC-type Fe3+ transport system permease subunit
MSAQPQLAAIIPLESRRLPPRLKPQQAIKAMAIFACCLLALIGSFADSAIARTGLLLIDSPDDPATGDLDGIAATLVWAVIANVAACAGVVMIAYWFLSRPTAQVVELRPRRYKS